MAQEKADVAKVWQQMKAVQQVFMATTEGKEPRVRPLMLIHADKNLYVTTGTGSAKVAQVKANPKTSLSWLIGEKDKPGYITIRGETRVVEDKKTKVRVAELVDWFKMFWKGTDDPTYTLLQVVPKEIEYMKPGAWKVQSFKL